jgi:uncharacterized protein YbjT (DUF2867 family)
MYVILGATGHIGSALSQQLLERGESVTVITRNAAKREYWLSKGAHVALVDVSDVRALRHVFERAERAFLLNPPAPPSTDTVAMERKTVRAMLDALTGSGLEKVVAESTYGAQPGDALGDLGVLYELEQGLKQQTIPATIVRGAYYMSNWDMSLDTARKEGRVQTLYPADFVLPMVAPRDIAALAAKLLLEPVHRTGLHFVEGPRRYSAADVAAAFAAALGKPVAVASVPPAQWTNVLQGMGFSAPAAQSMAAMTRATIEQAHDVPDSPVRATTTLDQYVRALVDSPPSQPQ